jgi:translation initiation factor 2 beta subunit (eIF-2beta)/eIF-5
LKFIGIELGSQTTYIEVSKNNITTIVQGAFNYETLIKVLDKFIDKYVCCPSKKL